jgi:predicted choloylglycine hydrolase
MLAPITFRSMLEHTPGEKLRKEFEYRWPAYRHWYLGDGNDARPGIDECIREFRTHMPELEPTLEQLSHLFGNDELVVRFLTLYCPPPIFKGCSQAIWLEPVKALIRNYDFPAHNWESIQLLSAWNGNPVMAMSDCIWGALDGINSYGLAVSLSFGGRSITGPGFGITIVLRYILEFATSVGEAVEILKRVPVSMAYNVSLIDRHGDYRTVMLAPDTGITVTRTRWATNHQELSTENNSFFLPRAVSVDASCPCGWVIETKN